jgi:endonuclease YncB( thermonuclease family)
MLSYERISKRNMKPIKILLIVTLAGLCLSLTPMPYHKVKFVYDGDTVLLENGEKVRYLGINAPEVDHTGGKSEYMAHEAWKFNREMVKGVQVRLEPDKETQDRYGRYLAYVFLNNGKMVNERLVCEGLAHVMFKDRGLKYGGLLLDSQRKAMKARQGIWKKKLKGNEKIYLGNSSSLRFHRQDCYFGGKISEKNLVRFKTIREAFWEGYGPCRRCNP